MGSVQNLFVAILKHCRVSTHSALFSPTYEIFPSWKDPAPFPKSAKTKGLHPDQNCFDTQTTFSLTLSDFDELWKLKQTRILADDNLFGRQSVNWLGLNVNERATCTWLLAAGTEILETSWPDSC